jgi:hypothetical protein
MEDVRRIDGGRGDAVAVSLDGLAREGARRMIATALEAEVADYVERFAEEVGDDGKRLDRAPATLRSPSATGARRPARSSS